MISQTSDPPYVKREVTNIYSPGTNIEYSIKGDTNNLVSIFVEEINNQNEIYCISPQSLNLIFKGDFNNQERLKKRFVELQNLTNTEAKLPSYFSFFPFSLSNKEELLEFMKINNIFV